MTKEFTAHSQRVMSSKSKWTLVYVPPSAPWSRMEFQNERGAQWRIESLVKSFPGMKAHLRILPPATAR